jgi:hypothetical protein
MGWLRALTVATAMAGLVCSAAQAKPRPNPNPHRYDLADYAKGEYDGDVISDSQGSSHSGVHITVTKIAPSTVKVSSDYPRLPTFTAKLTRAMQTIQNAGGSEVFLLDLNKVPHSLDVTAGGASWSGTVRR